MTVYNIYSFLFIIVYIVCIIICFLKVMLHDATSLMIFGFMKLVSPCDRAKNVSQETFKSLVRLFLR